MSKPLNVCAHNDCMQMAQVPIRGFFPMQFAMCKDHMLPNTYEPYQPFCRLAVKQK